MFIKICTLDVSGRKSMMDFFFFKSCIVDSLGEELILILIELFFFYVVVSFSIPCRFKTQI